MSNLSTIIAELQKLSSYELYRILTWINNKLDNPQAIYKTINNLSVGDQAQWFNSKINTEQTGLIISKGRTNVTVKGIDNISWNVPYYALNLDRLSTALSSQYNTKLTKNDFSVGEAVEFICEGIYYSGKITKLNPKTASVKLQEQPASTWRVSYCFLTKLIDCQARSIVGELLNNETS